jgi:branched-chain amino acid transport system ATP-binding protein
MLLNARGLRASYGRAQVLFDVSLSIEPGEVVTLIGRNGMGKTTTIRTLMGLVPLSAGEIDFAGERVVGTPPYRMARLGMGLVPEGRQIFQNLSVKENLIMAAIARGSGDDWTLSRVIDLFPRLGERLKHSGTQLSGGEQQMLAIGRALMTNPRLLLLDEATEGLAPVVREEIWSRLQALKRAGISILLVDKELEALCDIADRHYIIEKGEIVWSGTTSQLISNRSAYETYVGM